MSLNHNNENYIQKQGRLHEESALKFMGGDAENLNNNPKLEGMGLHAGNFPNFDIFSSNEICSVKSHLNQDGTPNIQSYKNDFSKMLGSEKAYADGLSPIQQDAKRIAECATKGVPIPTSLVGGSQEKIVSYLQENSIMRIPSDHVEQVRAALVDNAKQLPANYFLPENPTDTHLQSLADRIQSTGLSSEETLKILNPEQQAASETSEVKAQFDQEESLNPAEKTQEINQENPFEIDQSNDSETNEDKCDYGYIL
jgi:hypothetical protein